MGNGQWREVGTSQSPIFFFSICCLDIKKEKFLFLVFTSAVLCLSLNSKALRQPIKTRTAERNWCFRWARVIGMHKCVIFQGRNTTDPQRQGEGIWRRPREPLVVSIFELVVCPSSITLGPSEKISFAFLFS